MNRQGTASTLIITLPVPVMMNGSKTCTLTSFYKTCMPDQSIRFTIGSYRELMYHYMSNVTTRRPSERSKRQALWHEYIPRRALRYSFLLHGLLALSALHLAHMEEEESGKYLAIFDRHQAVALATFRRALSSNLDSDMADALCALAMTLSISSTARSCAVSGPMNMNDVAELFFLTRGVRDIATAAQKQVWEGPLAPFFENTTYPAGTAIFLPSHVSEHFNRLHEMVAEYGLDIEALAHCQSALHELEDIYRNIQYWATLSRVDISHVWQWQTRVHTGYIKLIQARCPPALVILACYSAAVSAVHGSWFTQSWARKAIRGVGFELPARMQWWIEWPMQQMQSTMAVLGVVRAVEEEDEGSGLFIGF